MIFKLRGGAVDPSQAHAPRPTSSPHPCGYASRHDLPPHIRRLSEHLVVDRTMLVLQPHPINLTTDPRNYKRTNRVMSRRSVFKFCPSPRKIGPCMTQTRPLIPCGLSPKHGFEALAAHNTPPLLVFLASSHKVCRCVFAFSP